jgi:small subunit ribosomal protein S20
MANHKSAIKRIRSNERKRLRNRYQAKTARTFIRRLRETEDKTEAQSLLKVVHSMIDKLVRKNIIHRNNGAHKKSKLAKHVASLA